MGKPKADERPDKMEEDSEGGIEGKKKKKFQDKAHEKTSSSSDNEDGSIETVGDDDKVERPNYM